MTNKIIPLKRENIGIFLKVVKSMYSLYDADLAKIEIKDLINIYQNIKIAIVQIGNLRASECNWCLMVEELNNLTNLKLKVMNELILKDKKQKEEKND